MNQERQSVMLATIRQQLDTIDTNMTASESVEDLQASLNNLEQVAILLADRGKDLDDEASGPLFARLAELRQRNRSQLDRVLADQPASSDDETRPLSTGYTWFETRYGEVVMGAPYLSGDLLSLWRGRERRSEANRQGIQIIREPSRTICLSVRTGSHRLHLWKVQTGGPSPGRPSPSRTDGRFSGAIYHPGWWCSSRCGLARRPTDLRSII